MSAPSSKAPTAPRRVPGPHSFRPTHASQALLDALESSGMTSGPFLNRLILEHGYATFRAMLREAEAAKANALAKLEKVI